MKIINTVQGSADWHSLRDRSIGSSDIPVILGLTKKTPFQLWCEKMGFGEKVSAYVEEHVMKPGLEVEQKLRDWFHMEYGVKVDPSVVQHDDFEWAIASLDGITKSLDLITEFKNVKQEYHQMACYGKVPEPYYAQCQWQMFCTDLQNVHYISHRDPVPAVVIVARDDKFIADTIPKAKDFWQYVVDKIPPALTERDYIDVSDDCQLTDDAIRYGYYQKMEKEYREKAEILKQELIQKTGERCVKGTLFKITKYPVKGRVDYGIIPELKDVDLEKYRKPNIISYKITVN